MKRSYLMFMGVFILAMFAHGIKGVDGAEYTVGGANDIMTSSSSSVLSSSSSSDPPVATSERSDMDRYIGYGIITAAIIFFMVAVIIVAILGIVTLLFNFSLFKQKVLVELLHLNLQ